MTETIDQPEQPEPRPSLSERLSRPTTVLTVGVLTFTLLGFVLGYLVNGMAADRHGRPGGEFGVVHRIDEPAGPKFQRSVTGDPPAMGKVTSISGKTVSLETPDGRTVKVNLKSGTRIAVLP